MDAQKHIHNGTPVYRKKDLVFPVACSENKGYSLCKLGLVAIPSIKSMCQKHQFPTFICKLILMPYQKSNTKTEQL